MILFQDEDTWATISIMTYVKGGLFFLHMLVNISYPLFIKYMDIENLHNRTEIAGQQAYEDQLRVKALTELEPERDRLIEVSQSWQGRLDSVNEILSNLWGTVHGNPIMIGRVSPASDSITGEVTQSEGHIVARVSPVTFSTLEHLSYDDEDKQTKSGSSSLKSAYMNPLGKGKGKGKGKDAPLVDVYGYELSFYFKPDEKSQTATSNTFCIGTERTIREEKQKTQIFQDFYLRNARFQNVINAPLDIVSNFFRLNDKIAPKYLDYYEYTYIKSWIDIISQVEDSVKIIENAK